MREASVRVIYQPPMALKVDEVDTRKRMQVVTERGNGPLR